MKPRNWNPKDGDALQGDVILFRLPDEISLSLDDEISARGQRLILAEGEITGHHHAIWLRNPPTMLREDGAGSGASAAEVEALVRKATSKRIATAKLYRDAAAVERLVRLGELQHARTAIGFLVVEGGSVVLRHDEHEAIRIPEGRYFVGGQQEWDAAEARRVQD